MNKDQLQAIQALKTSRGQIDGIVKMMEELNVKDAFINNTGEDKVDEI